MHLLYAKRGVASNIINESIAIQSYSTNLQLATTSIKWFHLTRDLPEQLQLNRALRFNVTHTRNMRK